MILVVGSGPAGVSAAAALLRNGHQVALLDAGLTLEENRQEVVHHLSTRAPVDWDAESIATIKENLRPTGAGIPLKHSYGSDFPYRHADRFIPSQMTRAGILPSLAKGGLSNVWGAAVLPYSADDFNGWPITLAELASHYESVARFMQLSAGHDDLENKFPLYSEEPTPLPQSRQARQLLADMTQHRASLRAQGIWFGAARIAMQRGHGNQNSCVSCGLCMHGCPYGLIYNAATTLDSFSNDPAFTYRGGLIVEKFAETRTGVQITARRIEDRSTVTLEGAALFVAAGTLSTTRIFLQSVEAFDHTLTLKDSQYFLLPLLRAKRVPDVFDESLHTLSQVFLEVFDERISAHNVHLQLYTYNELFRDAIENSLGAFNKPLKFLSRAFLERFLLLQGYLHSDLSSTINLTLRAKPDGNPHTLEMEGKLNPAARSAFKQVVRKLRGCTRLLKATPLAPLARMGEPGRGFHSGGTLPMRHSPQSFETDRWGRPAGFRRVHLVDATVFPTISANTITFTVMANAHRIASAYGTTESSA